MPEELLSELQILCPSQNPCSAGMAKIVHTQFRPSDLAHGSLELMIKSVPDDRVTFTAYPSCNLVGAARGIGKDPAIDRRGDIANGAGERVFEPKIVY